MYEYICTLSLYCFFQERSPHPSAGTRLASRSPVRRWKCRSRVHTQVILVVTAPDLEAGNVLYLIPALISLWYRQIHGFPHYEGPGLNFELGHEERGTAEENACRFRGTIVGKPGFLVTLDGPSSQECMCLLYLASGKV